MLKKVVTDKAPAAIGPYSQGIIVNGMLFASGQIPIDPATGEITTVVFDRGGYIYHGKVAALADAAREAGLEF